MNATPEAFRLSATIKNLLRRLRRHETAVIVLASQYTPATNAIQLDNLGSRFQWPSEFAFAGDPFYFSAIERRQLSVRKGEAGKSAAL